MVVLELAADEMMAIKPAGQTTGAAAAAAGYSAGYGLPIEEERENETGGAMQCKREAGGALARRKKIKAKGDELSFAGGWSSKGKGLGIGPEQGMMESGERRRGKSLQPENFTYWNARLDREAATCKAAMFMFIRSVFSKKKKSPPGLLSSSFLRAGLSGPRTVSAATLGNLRSLG